MRKIEFGFNNDLNPKPQWEGIGISPQSSIISADYYGAIEFEGNNYVVVKVVDDPNNHYPELVNSFIVRQAVYDLYADGSGALFLDQGQNVVTHKLEQYLNNDMIKGNINNYNDIIKYCEGVHMPFMSFKLLESGFESVSIVATSITSEAFETKNNAIKNCRQSISNMQIELSHNYTK